MYPIKKVRFADRFVKRVLDVCFGLVLLILSAPAWLLAALAVRIETPGNPFFVQTRVGLGGERFKILKLRGMYIDAPVRFARLYDYSRFGNLDFQFHYQEDPRITRVGSFIRRTSIDEFPNFFNVVRGDMTLVGPRPEVPDVFELYGDYRAEYVSVKPGITCLSKIAGRDNLTKQESIEMDLGYVRKASLRLDAYILWRTIVGVLLHQDVFHRGAAAETFRDVPESTRDTQLSERD